MSKVEKSVEILDKLYRVAIGDQRRGGIAGQAFTSYMCLKCENFRMHSSTNTPHLCPDCTDEVVEQYAKRKANED